MFLQSLKRIMTIGMLVAFGSQFAGCNAGGDDVTNGGKNGGNQGEPRESFPVMLGDVNTQKEDAAWKEPSGSVGNVSWFCSTSCLENLMGMRFCFAFMRVYCRCDNGSEREYFSKSLPEIKIPSAPWQLGVTESEAQQICDDWRSTLAYRARLNEQDCNMLCRGNGGGKVDVEMPSVIE